MEVLAVFAVSSALFYWLWTFYRGGWKKVVLWGHGLGCGLAEHAVGFSYLFALLLGVLGVLFSDLSAVAGALVLWTVGHVGQRSLRSYGRSKAVAKALNYLVREDD